LPSAPTGTPYGNLCQDGSTPAVSGSGPWTWTCQGTNGGTNVSCSANKQAVTPAGCTLLPLMNGTNSDVVNIGGHTNDTNGYINYCFDVPANMDTVSFAIFSADWATNQDLIMSSVGQPTWDTWRNTVQASVSSQGYALSRKATAQYWYAWSPTNNESLIIYGMKSSAVKRYYATIFNTSTSVGLFKYGWNAY